MLKATRLGSFQSQVRIAISALIAVVAGASTCAADEIALGPKLALTAPEGWEKKQPRSSIVAYEYAAPSAEGDAAPGRFTVMAAGGGVQANLDRWYSQFTQPDGGKTSSKAQVEKKTIAGQEVTLVDISGTFDDKPGPMAPGVKREKYRMLGAIFVGQGAEFYLKLTGPENTIAKHRKAFVAMVDGLSSK